MLVFFTFKQLFARIIPRLQPIFSDLPIKINYFDFKKKAPSFKPVFFVFFNAYSVFRLMFYFEQYIQHFSHLLPSYIFILFFIKTLKMFVKR